MQSAPAKQKRLADRLMDFTGSLMFIVSWLAGIVLANGALSTVMAVCFPPYAWYLVVEKAMMVAGVA